MSATASAVLMDAREAAEAEGIFEATPEQKTTLRRIAALTRMIVKHEAEVKALKASLISQMASVGAQILMLNGKKMVHIVDKTAEEVYLDQMRLTYPDIVADYERARDAFEAKKSEFTFRVAATPAKTFPGVK